MTPANRLPGMPAQGPPGPAPRTLQLKARPRTSWARIAERKAISKPSPAPQGLLRPAPRRPLATPRPPRPTTVLRPQPPRRGATPRRDPPWIGVQSVASGAPAHATSAPRREPPRRRTRLRRRPRKENGSLGPMRPRPLSELPLRTRRMTLRPPPTMWMRPRARPPSWLASWMMKRAPSARWSPYRRR